MTQAIWVLISLLALAVGAGIVRIGWGREKTSYGARGEKVWVLIPGWLVVAGGIAGIVTLAIMWPVQYYTSLGDRYALEGFLATRCSYVQSIDEAQSVIIAGAEGKGELLDFTYLAQAGEFTNVVRDLRAKTDWYNTQLRKLETLRRAPVVGSMRVGAGDLEPITSLLRGCE